MYNGTRGKGMKRKIIRAVSAVLIFAMVASVTACNRSAKEKKIKANTPWYDTGVVKADIGIDKERDLYGRDSRLAGSDDKNYIILTSGSYDTPGDNPTIKQLDDSVFVSISVVDKETGITAKTIDLKGEIRWSDRIVGASYKSGIVNLHVYATDPDTGESKTIDKDIDIDTGKIKDSQEYSEDGFIPQRCFVVGDYKADYDVKYPSGNAFIILRIYSPDGSFKNTNLKEAGIDMYDLKGIISAGDTTALAVADSSSGDRFFEVDLKTGEARSLDPKDYEWISSDDLAHAYSINGGTYYTSSMGIFKLDLDKKTTEQVVDFSYCSINRNILKDLQVANVDGDSYILCGQHAYKTYYNMAADVNFYIIKFNKAAKNPHAGKTILELYVPDGPTNNRINDAVLEFNETNKECFIEITDKYQTSATGSEFSINTHDDNRNRELNGRLEMSTRLAMDIMSGEGPDIIMNASMLGQLNNSSYLADLSPYFNDLDPEKYFTNLIEGSKVDGKLYQMPLCYLIEGIYTDKNNAGASGTGFTTEEYEKFLYDVLNGKDVIESGQAYYFATVFNSMKEKFIRDGKADFTGPEFAVLADFVKENVPERGFSDESLRDIAVYKTCHGLIDYFYYLAQIKGEVSILGIPSSDGRGPMFRAYTSVAVSSQSQNVEAAVEFIKILMSDKIQEDLAMQENYVINKAAFRKAGLAAVEYFNGPETDNLFGYDPTGKPLENRMKFSEKKIDDLEKIILSCSSVDSEDQAVSIILLEEMPAYFTGQKSLDEVIKIAQNRAQKVLDERK